MPAVHELTALILDAHPLAEIRRIPSRSGRFHSVSAQFHRERIRPAQTRGLRSAEANEL